MTLPNKKYKIALVGYSLSSGGLERVMSSLSVYFDKQGIEVHNIVFVDDVTYPYSGVLVNIGKMKETRKGIMGKFQLLLFFKNYIQRQHFDFVIDLRYRKKPFQEVVIANWIYDSNTIYTVHSGKTATYIPRNKLLANLIFKSKYAVVCVSDAIKKLVDEKYDFKNTKRIYNPIDLNEIQQKTNDEIDLDFTYVVGMGRFDQTNVKQFDKLIDTYLKSDLPSKNIHLVLIGDGERKSEMEKSVNKNRNIHFLGFKENPYPYLNRALFLILSSKYEGFGLALAESLACGTPVISFDCSCGPNEIISHEKNGLLVENQNFKMLSEAMNLFVEDKELYAFCKKNSIESVSRFSMEKIGQEWLNLMKIEVNS